MRAKDPARKNKRRVGRGTGSGKGKTSSRGQKGQGSRSGAKTRPGFEGGQNPLYRRLPKRGFNNAAFAKRFAIVNVNDFENSDVAEITPETLLKSGVLKKLYSGVKVLGYGDLSKKVTVKAHRFSQSAKEKIEKAGGQAVLIEK